MMDLARRLRVALRWAARLARRLAPTRRIVPGPDDLVLREPAVGATLFTNGRVIVLRHGCGVVGRVEAERGVEIQGGLKGDVCTPGRIRLSKGGWLDGQCSASSLVVEAGCEINGFLEIGRERLAKPNPIRDSGRTT